MGAIGGLVGLNGGAGGTGYSIQSPVDVNQANTAYTGVQNGLTSQQSLLQALQQQGALQNQQNVYGQLQGVVNGTGPNPAQAMLNQATGANVASQASLMAGQRGASSNVGLIARQAAQQGAQTQQQAVGQGATMQAQQSLNALGAAGNMANTQAGQLLGQTNQNVASQSQEQQNLLNSIAGVNSANAGLASQTMQGQQGLLGGLMNGIGGIGGIFGGSSGAAGAGATGGSSGLTMPALGSSAGYAEGGSVGPRSHIGRSVAMVSPGEIYLNPSAVQKVEAGESPQAVGEKIKGKANVPGAVNSYANDTVKKTMQTGGVVVPNSETKSGNPEKDSKRFVAATLAKRRARA